ncbi:S8 family peptidase [Phytohabitans rumicis]|uniref:S8 family peptidase n=1 Tax=Phytohabitans rumicis TaxID=1076125 RepID=UPI0031ECC5B8
MAAALVVPGPAAGADAARPAGPAPLLDVSDPTVPGSYVVVLTGAPGTARAASAVARAQALGATIEHRYDNALNGFAARLTPDQLAAVRDDPDVAYVAPDVRTTLDEAASAQVAQTPAVWGLDRVDQRELPLDNRYDYRLTGAGVTVYVIDSGIRTDHTEFGGRASPGVSFVNDGYGTNDCSGHGTHVAGTIGGATYGVARAVSLVSVRVMGCINDGSVAAVIAAVDWVTDNHAATSVANLSLSVNAYQPLDDAINRSIDSGVTYVAAAGNDNGSACAKSPGRGSRVITVGASTITDARYSLSNHGPCVDLFAPGVDITSAASSSTVAGTNKSGTSMASPHVAGAAALYLQTQPAAPYYLVLDWITSRATPGVLSDIGAFSPNLLLYAATPATHAGMTWQVLEQRADNVIRVGTGGQTDPYHGDTPASASLPLLCLLPSNAGSLAELFARKPADITTSQYAGWTDAWVQLTAPVSGSALTGPTEANRLCAASFGAGWRMAEFHDGWYMVSGGLPRPPGFPLRVFPSGWSFWAYGTLPTTNRFWVSINDQPANSWD